MFCDRIFFDVHWTWDKKVISQIHTLVFFFFYFLDVIFSYLSKCHQKLLLITKFRDIEIMKKNLNWFCNFNIKNTVCIWSNKQFKKRVNDRNIFEIPALLTWDWENPEWKIHNNNILPMGSYFYYVDNILAIFVPPSPLVDKHRHLANPP